jgi:hypothetical protein
MSSAEAHWIDRALDSGILDVRCFFPFIWSFDWIWSAVLYESVVSMEEKRPARWPPGKMLNKRREFNCREVVTSIPV